MDTTSARMSEAYISTELGKISSIIHILQHDALQSLSRIHATLGVEHNKRARINLLPLEILRLIFEFVGDFAGDEIGRHPALSLSHTCTYWRAIALQHPGMWGRVDMTKASDGLIKLVRSMTNGLALKRVFCRVRHTEQLGVTFVSKELARIEDLEIAGIHASNYNFEDLLTKSTSSEHPMLLRRLSLWDTTIFPSTLPNRLWSKPLFGGRAPHLCDLELHGVRLPWDTGFYPSTLSRLCVTGSKWVESHDQGIRLVLRDCPNLVYLEIACRGNTSWRSGPDSTPLESTKASIPLRHLRVLKLDLSAYETRNILSSIDLETLDTLHLHLALVTSQDYDLVASLWQPGLIPHGFFASLTRFWVVSNQIRDVDVLTGWTTGDSKEPAFLLDYVREWSLWQPSGPSILSRIASSIAAHNVMPKLQDLTLRSRLGADDDRHPLTAFAQRPSLTTLRLGDDGASAILLHLMSPEVREAAQGWPELYHVMVTSTLNSRATEALVVWCRSLSSLEFLDLRNSSLQVESTRDIRRTVREIQGLGAEVCWDACNFWIDDEDEEYSVEEDWLEESDDDAGA